jgi:hypothetical protein
MGGHDHHWVAALLLLAALFITNAAIKATEEINWKELVAMIADCALKTARDLTAALLASAVVAGLGGSPER